LKSLCATLLILFCANQSSAAATEDGLRSGGAEVQINLCSEPGQIITALQLVRKEARPREIWYFDSAGLDLFRRGVLFRLRSTGRKHELTLKVGNQECGRVNPELLPIGLAKCEYDVHGAHSVGAVSISRTLDESQVYRLLEGQVELADLLSPAQVRYLREVADVWPLTPGMKRLGPALIETYHRKGRPFDVELWQLPSGRRYAEISQKCRLEDASRVQAELEEMLDRKKVNLCPDQGALAAERLKDLLGR
jgi:hypothetical protein